MTKKSKQWFKIKCPKCKKERILRRKPRNDKVICHKCNASESSKRATTFNIYGGW